MKPVFQINKGDCCFQACVASLLELPIECVPDVAGDAEWLSVMNSWIAGFGLGLIEVEIDRKEPFLYPMPSGILLIVSGKTIRHESLLHSVVAMANAGGMDFKYIHDPHPKGTFLTTPMNLTFIVKLDPAINILHV